MADAARKADDRDAERGIQAPDGPFAMAVDEVLSAHDVDPETGLKAGDVEERRERFGENRLAESQSKGALTILVHQFKSVIVWLLGAGAVFSFVIGDLWEAAAIGVVLLINTGIGFFTELRATRSMEALREISEFTTRVRRDGETETVKATELTCGDIVLLEAGDVVTADLRLIETSHLECNESALTGESLPGWHG